MLWTEKCVQYLQLLFNKVKALKWAKPTSWLASPEFAIVFFRLIATNSLEKYKPFWGQWAQEYWLLYSLVPHNIGGWVAHNQFFLYQQ